MQAQRRTRLAEAYLGQAYFAGGTQQIPTNQALGQPGFGQGHFTPSGTGAEPGPVSRQDQDLSPYGLGGLNFRRRRRKNDDQEIMVLVTQAMDRLTSL